MPEEYAATVTQNVIETPSVNIVKLKFARPMEFEPGQWVYLYAQREGNEVKKPYSIASPPSMMKNRAMELCIKRIENGFMSNFLCDLKKGDALKITGPYGVFGIKDNSNDKIFVATGSGIAPFRSMIPTLLENDFAKDIWLFFGVRTESDIIYNSFFSSLQSAKKNFHFVPILSRQPHWKGEKGHVQDVLPKYLDSAENKDVYICGLIPMIDEVASVLEELKFKKSQLHFEKYV